MYNIKGAIGIGIFQTSDKTMGLYEASKLLDKQEYFDYLKGVIMKTSFSSFSIMDYEKNDKSQGEGKFLKTFIIQLEEIQLKKKN